MPKGCFAFSLQSPADQHCGDSSASDHHVEGSEGSEGGTGEGGTGEGGNQERARSHADEGQIRRATSRGRCTGSGVNQKGGRSRGDSWISSV
jgi:hypothetical protein